MTRFLIVDDSGVVRKVARRILEDFGYVCEEAADGQKALDACNAAMPDAILLDWNMPVMDGIQFLKALRGTTPQGDKPQVIFCTTENDMDHIMMAMEAGANEYIMKPFDADIVRSKLEQLGMIAPLDA